MAKGKPTKQEVESVDETTCGPELIDKVVSLSGLPQELAETELGEWIESSGHRAEELTLDELRMVLIKYLESTNEALLGRNS